MHHRHADPPSPRPQQTAQRGRFSAHPHRSGLAWPRRGSRPVKTDGSHGRAPTARGAEWPDLRGHATAVSTTVDATRAAGTDVAMACSPAADTRGGVGRGGALAGRAWREGPCATSELMVGVVAPAAVAVHRPAPPPPRWCLFLLAGRRRRHPAHRPRRRRSSCGCRPWQSNKNVHRRHGVCKTGAPTRLHAPFNAHAPTQQPRGEQKERRQKKTGEGGSRVANCAYANSARQAPQRYMDSFLRFCAISASHRSPLASSLALLYSSSSCVSVAYSMLGPSTMASAWKRPAHRGGWVIRSG